jgi:hypothetical protein
MANPNGINEKLNYHFINDNNDDDINNEFNDNKNKNIMTNPIEVIKNREDIIKKQSEQMLNLVEIVQKYNEENEGLQKIVKECNNKNNKPEIVKDIDYMKNLMSNQLILFMILLILFALLYYKKMNF